jgi:transcriptional regulator with XRE-family HTH domain|tara:strand:+ start:5451 stop:5693 length:243 start_codon:yes stop_codon:yes gene_type:complete
MVLHKGRGKDMDIKEMLRALLRAGYTEEAIAKGAKVHQSTISRILSGKIRQPKYAVACKVQALVLSENKFKSSRLSNTIL